MWWWRCRSEGLESPASARAKAAASSAQAVAPAIMFGRLRSSPVGDEPVARQGVYPDLRAANRGGAPHQVQLPRTRLPDNFTGVGVTPTIWSQSPTSEWSVIQAQLPSDVAPRGPVLIRPSYIPTTPNNRSLHRTSDAWCSYSGMMRLFWHIDVEAPPHAAGSG